MPQTPVQFPTNVLQTPESRPRKVATCPKKSRIKSKKGDRQTDHRTNKRAKVTKWTVSEAAVARSTGKIKRVSTSDDVLNGRRRNVDERTRRDLDESDYK